MITIGLALLALSIFALWACLPNKDATPKRFLRGGADVLAAIVIVTSFGLGFVVLIIGIGQT